MASTLLLLISVLSLTASLQAAKKLDKYGKNPAKVERQSICDEETQGLTFDDSQVLGTWQVLQYKTKYGMEAGGPECVEFLRIREQERKNISETVGKYSEKHNWEKLTFKMMIPCTKVDYATPRAYYLEKLQDDASYNTIWFSPPTSTVIKLYNVHYFSMRLKMFEGEYLGMMDCFEQFVFLLAKNPPRDPEVLTRLNQIVENFWPNKH